jgi:hypothetical protein
MRASHIIFPTLTINKNTGHVTALRQGGVARKNSCLQFLQYGDLQYGDLQYGGCSCNRFKNRSGR